MARTRKSREFSFAQLDDEKRAELDAIEKGAILKFNGPLDELEKAIGILRLGHQFGWRVLVLVHSKRTIRKYEGILGITFREFFPPEGPSAQRSIGLRMAEKFDNFWKIVSGDIKIEHRSEIVRD